MTKAIGIVLVALGLAGLVWGGFSYTTRKPIVDIGPIHATQEQIHDVRWPRVAGALALAGGIVLLATARRT